MTAQIFRSVDRGHLGNVRKQLAINPSALHATTPSDGQTPLHRAAALGDGEMIRELLAHDAKYDVADKYGNTPLHLACQSASLEAVVALLAPEMRHTLRLKNRDGQTPLHVAVLVGTKQIVRQLVVSGARVDVKDKEDQTPLDLVSGDADDLLQAMTAKTDRNESSEETIKKPYPRNMSPITPRGQKTNAKMPFDKQSQLTALKSRRLKHLSSSPEKGYARYNDTTQRSLPRKQLQLHEMAIQGLQSELQDLGFRADNIEHFLNESQENFDKLENLAGCIESQDRQLAELDQRLQFQEAHLRDLRPRVNSIGDESRHNKKQSEDLREMVESLKETARSSLGSVLTRVKEWEAAAITLKEGPEKQGDSDDGSQFQINHLEQQIIDTNRLVKDAKAASERSIQLALGLESKLKDVQDRMTIMEDGMKETIATTSADDACSDEEEDSDTKRQVQDLMENVEALKTTVTRTAAQTDKIEEMYKQHLSFESERKAEQDKEMSQREARILELRKIALEEENERRDFGRAQEEQHDQMLKFEKKVDEAIAQAERDASLRTELEAKIMVMEAELARLNGKLEIKESLASKKKGGCCTIS